MIATETVSSGYTVALRQRYLLSILACATIAALFAAESYFWSQVNDRGLSYLRTFALSSPPWLAYSAIAPLVAAWGLRHRLEWPVRAPAVAAQLAGVVVTLVLFAAMATLADHWLGYSVPRDPPWIHFRNALVYETPLVVITYSATIGVGYAAESNRRARELARLQTELTQAQLAALRMQLSPHFLFNALHTIAAIVREHDERQAVELIERLGDVLRHVLHSGSELEVPLAEELGFLAKYLEIEQARFGDRLTVSVTASADAQGALVPQLILQPLVENALRHGLAPRAAPGALQIEAERQGDVLALAVRDDGLGLADGWDTEDGLGLANVRTRLARMYDSAGELVLAERTGGGVVATVTLPYRRAQG